MGDNVLPNGVVGMPASGSGEQRYGCAASFESACAAFEAIPALQEAARYPLHDADEILEGAEAQEESKVAVNKITWAQVGLVTEPGRYMFKFGWLTITADDVAIWQKYPTAAFTLYTMSVAPEAEDETDKAAGEVFRLGTSSYEPIPTIRKAKNDRLRVTAGRPLESYQIDADGFAFP